MELDKLRVLLVFKDFAAWLHASGVGLNVAGYATAAVLKEHEVDAGVLPVRNNIDLVNGIIQYQSERNELPTHVIISAPWLSVFDLTSILKAYPTIEFVILSHSNVGFLQADPFGVSLLKQYLQMTQTYQNLVVGANSERLFVWLRDTVGGDVVLLPNLYPIKGAKRLKNWARTEPLRIGIFGVVRPEKNFMSAAAAAITIQKKTGVSVELHMSTGGEGGGVATEAAISQLVESNQKIQLIKHEWMMWYDFIKLVEAMDLLIQPSFTESFNMVTADGILMGVPSVVSTAIEWAPFNWKADSDDVNEIAEVGMSLLNTWDPGEGKRAIEQHNNRAWRLWKMFLTTGEQKSGFLESLWNIVTWR